MTSFSVTVRGIRGVSDSITQIKASFQETPPRFGLVQRPIPKAPVENSNRSSSRNIFRALVRSNCPFFRNDIAFLQKTAFQNAELGAICEVSGDVVDVSLKSTVT